MVEPAPWPRMMLGPRETLEWLGQQRPADRAGQRAVLTLRWLVHAELERAGPDPPDEFFNVPPDLTSGQS